MASNDDDALIEAELNDPARVTTYDDQRVEQHDAESLQRILGRRRSGRLTRRSVRPCVAKYSSEG